MRAVSLSVLSVLLIDRMIVRAIIVLQYNIIPILSYCNYRTNTTVAGSSSTI